MSTNTTNTEAAQKELREIALLLAEYADAEDISRAKFITEHRENLGSDKTFGSILKGDFSELDVDRWLSAYRIVRDVISDAGEADPLYDDLSTTKRVRSAISRLKLSKTLAKLVIIKGYTASGKTSALKVIREKYNAMNPTQYVYATEASAGWSDRPTAMLGAMLKALGMDAGARNTASRQDRLIEALNVRGVMLTIDEVHDLGPRCLRVIKHLLNNSPLKIVMACHPRLWRQLEAEASDDLSQLTGNRLLASIDLGTLSVDDVKTLLSRRLVASGLDGDLSQAAALVAEAALNYGNLAFVREIIVRLNKQARKLRAGHLTLDHVKDAISKERHARRPEASKA